MLDSFPLPTTRIARNLYLLEDAWRKHVFLDLDSMPVTSMARIHLSIRTPASFAFLANHLFLKLKFCGMTVVEILQWNTDSDFHVRSSSLAPSMAEMSASAEEPGKEVEGVVVLAAAASLLPLFEAFVSVLVVDFAGFGVRESFVSFCYLDELLLRGGIPTACLLNLGTN